MTYQTVNGERYTNKLVKSYDFATDQEIDATIEKAYDAFLTWRTTGPDDRPEVLTRTAEWRRATSYRARYPRVRHQLVIDIVDIDAPF